MMSQKYTQDEVEGPEIRGLTWVVPLQWIDTLYSCCNAIARVNDAAYGAPAGSGFVVSGRIFASRWGDGPLFLTNAMSSA